MLSKVFILTLSAVLTIEVIFSFVPHSEFLYRYSRPIDDDEFRFAYRLARAEPGAIFFIGSSQAREDYDVAQLSEKIGRPVVNLGLSGASFLDWYVLSDTLLEKDPSLVVLTTYIGDYLAPAEFNPWRFEIKKGLSTLAPWQLFQAREGVYRGLVAELLPSFRYRSSIVHVLYRSLRGEENASEFGAVQKSEEYFTEELKGSVRHFLSDDVGLQRESLVRFVEAFERAGVPVIVVQGQLYPGFERFVDSDATLSYEETLEAASRTGADVVSGGLPVFDKKLFADFTHLNQDGRAQMTAAMARLLEGY